MIKRLRQMIPDSSHTIVLSDTVLEVRRDEESKRISGKDRWMILYFVDEEGRQQSWIDYATPKQVAFALRDLKQRGYMNNYSVQFPSDQYWHPDYVIFKGRTDSGTGWFIGQRTAGGIDPGHHGPFKTKGMAKRAVLGGE